MNRLIFGTVGTALLLLSLPSFAFEIVACEPEWAQLAREIGGEKVSVHTLVAGNQDPHHFSPTASSLSLARQARLLVCNSIGNDQRLTRLINQSENPRIRAGQPGFLEAGRYATASTAQGETRTSAAHHVQSDPRNILLVADALTKRLTAIDPANSHYYDERQHAFSERWSAAMQHWKERAAPLNGLAFVAQRNSCEYLCNWLGVQKVAELESAQGGTVNTKQMREVLDSLQVHHASMIVTGPYHRSQAVAWLAHEARLPVVTLPKEDDAASGAKDLYSYFDIAIDRMLKVVSRS